MQEKENKPGRPPSGLPRLPTRSIRMDDTRWKFFKEKLSTDWLREKIDAEIKISNKPAASQPTK